MKTLLVLILFIIIVPLLIGYLAGQSKSDLVQLATMAGLITLFILYLVFIDKEPKNKQAQHPSHASAQSNSCDVTCIHDNYSRDEEDRREQHASDNEVYSCDPEYPY